MWGSLVVDLHFSSFGYVACTFHPCKDYGNEWFTSVPQQRWHYVTRWYLYPLPTSTSVQGTITRPKTMLRYWYGNPVKIFIQENKKRRLKEIALWMIYKCFDHFRKYILYRENLKRYLLLTSFTGTRHAR